MATVPIQHMQKHVGNENGQVREHSEDESLARAGKPPRTKANINVKHMLQIPQSRRMEWSSWLWIHLGVRA